LKGGAASRPRMQIGYKALPKKKKKNKGSIHMIQIEI